MQKNTQKKKSLNLEAVEIGKRIRAVRKARHMTGEQLAEAAETSSQFLSKVEKGEQSMTTGKFCKLVKALGVSSDYILFGQESAAEQVALAAEYLGGLSKTEQEMLSRVILSLQETLKAMQTERE